MWDSKPLCVRANLSHCPMPIPQPSCVARDQMRAQYPSVNMFLGLGVLSSIAAQQSPAMPSQSSIAGCVGLQASSVAAVPRCSPCCIPAMPCPRPATTFTFKRFRQTQSRHPPPTTIVYSLPQPARAAVNDMPKNALDSTNAARLPHLPLMWRRTKSMTVLREINFGVFWSFAFHARESFF